MKIVSDQSIVNDRKIKEEQRVSNDYVKVKKELMNSYRSPNNDDTV